MVDGFKLYGPDREPLLPIERDWGLPPTAPPDPIEGMRAIGRIYKDGRMFKMQWLPGVYVDDDAFEGGELLYTPVMSGEAGSGNAPTPATTGEAGSVLPPPPSEAGAPPPPTVPELMEALEQSVNAAKAARRVARDARNTRDRSVG